LIESALATKELLMTDRIVKGFCQGFDIQAAVHNAIESVPLQTNKTDGFTLAEIKFSRGGFVGPATHVELVYKLDEEE
jgi:hypothetical protein